MATKRRSKQQIQADRIIKKQLLILGDNILEESVPNSRRDTGRLQDEQNFRVEKDTTLVMAQMYYGAFNYPVGKNSGEKNALLIAVNNQVPKATKVIIKNINDSLLKPFKK
jgi:hypothetical protein